MNPTAIYSKSGKGVQEASGKTSLLKRPDRAVLSAIDGRANLQEVAQKCGKTFDPAFQALITQLDKDGFIREISAGAASAAPPKPAAVAPKPAAKPAAKAADTGGGGDLDFSSLSVPSRPAAPPSRPGAPPKPAAPTPPVSQALDFSSIGMAPKPAAQPPQQQVDALTKAREEAEAKAAAEREKMRAEAEAKTRAELEAKLRAEAEKKLKEKAESDAAAEAKVKAAREAALKAAEAKVKAEQEAKAKIEAERKAREETEKRLEAERKAREEAEKKAKEEAERARREAEEKARKEQEELKQRLEAERKAREEAERKAKEEAERARKELEEERKRLEAERRKEEEERAARRKKEEEEAAARRKKQEEEERKAEEEREAKRRKREEEEAAREAEEKAQREAKRKQREAEEAAREAEEQAKRETEREAKRKKREEEEAERERVEEELRAEEKRKKAAQPAPAPKAEGKKDSFADSLLADLDSFNNREEEEAKAKAEEERKRKAEAERRQREEAERQAKDEAERERAEQEAARRKEEEARRAREEEERRAQEEERRKREAEEIRRKAEAATAAAMAKEGKAPVSFEDIPISDDDLGMDEVKKEKAALAKARPKEEEEPPPPPKPIRKKKEVDEAPVRVRRPGNWGKKIGIAAVLLLVIGVGVLHVMPISTAEYERAATEALGRPVKIGSAKMWLVTGPQVRLENVTVGDAKISLVTAAIGSAFGDRKELGTIELDGLTLPQQSLGDAIFATVRGDNFRVERILVKNLQLPGPAVLPKSLQADIQLDAQGAMRAANLRGPDGLFAKLTPKDSSIEFDVIAAGFTLPIAPEITLSKFAMKGTATPRGMTIPEWGGAIFNGGISGTANVRWGGTWTVEGVVTVRGINAAVFAPALLSGGTGEGTGRFSMSGADPAKLGSAGRLDGNFTITQGTLGSFDLARAIQSNGKNASGTTQFVEMNGQAVYDRGAVALRNITIGAGALNAGASADIASSGALSGRIVADVKAASQIRSATLLLGGTVKEPQVRN